MVVAIWVAADGRCEVLGFDVGYCETEAFWTSFLRSLKTRGLDGVKLVISDALSCGGDFGQRTWWFLLRCQGWLLITMVDFVGSAVAER
ncbi:hypothetical protein RCH22_000546 [Cryobacterium psychrotolerans]|nr:hypothetical protein [Cryobacterium psychrotolerans]